MLLLLVLENKNKTDYKFTRVYCEDRVYYNSWRVVTIRVLYKYDFLTFEELKQIYWQEYEKKLKERKRKKRRIKLPRIKITWK